ncbi:Clp protease N-terminal domain-containing protein [Kribbella sp. VKM Ac-2568]|uniref:Clp protease N-terminal domain-containing protein n=1 Tax=Kribbella sp. VKM Ac-2568 TaxID=2512219 RepID=UPI001053564C|nr:Clp protease N-terminal domain-containing protein [Kribbella sp. VKM Ac-2568]TCM43411.1 ClpA/ClpB-like protein [Kribbella sp. VKM Ac-2568]
MTPGPDLQQLIDTIRADAGTDDVLDQLGTAASTISELTSTSDAALGYFVDRARGAGKSWVEISTVLGVSKQAAHKRFAESWTSRPAFEHYTPRTRAAVEAAADVARGLTHSYVGTEHLLLAFYTQPEALATKVLVAHGVTEQAVSEAVNAAVPAGEGPVNEEELGFTRRASHVLQGAAGEALALGHNYVGTEHLLLAFYRDQAGVATTVLQGLGLDESAAWAAIRAVLNELETAK